MKNATAKIVITGRATWRDGLRVSPRFVGRDSLPRAEAPKAFGAERARPFRIGNKIFMFSIPLARISLPPACGNSITNHRADRSRQRHRRSDRLLLSAQTRRGKFQSALPISPGENPVVPCQPAATNLSLLWMRGGRKRFPLCDGLRAHRFSFRRAQAGGARWDSGDRRAGPERRRRSTT